MGAILFDLHLLKARVKIARAKIARVEKTLAQYFASSGKRSLINVGHYKFMRQHYREM